MHKGNTKKSNYIKNIENILNARSFQNIRWTLKKSTPTYMIYGELGIKPISLDIKARVMLF